MKAVAYIPGVGFLDRDLKYKEIKVGVYERTRTNDFRGTYWRMRVKRRGAGHTWRRLREIPKELRAEALIMGVTLE